VSTNFLRLSLTLLIFEEIRFIQVTDSQQGRGSRKLNLQFWLWAWLFSAAGLYVVRENQVFEPYIYYQKYGVTNV